MQKERKEKKQKNRMPKEVAKKQRLEGGRPNGSAAERGRQ